MPTPKAEMRALVVSPDTGTSAVFVEVFQNLGVVAEVRQDHSSASKLFSQSKFEAVIADFDNILEPIPFIQHLHQGGANRNAVVLAIATHDSARQRASKHSVRFTVARPLAASELMRVLRAAYGLMLQDRRRYFRLVVDLPVSLRTSAGTEVQCNTINVSSEGMALRTPRSMQVGETVGVVFAISNPGPLVIAMGTVIWDDKHGKSGLHLAFATAVDKDRISEWLDSEFYMQSNLAESQ